MKQKLTCPHCLEESELSSGSPLKDHETWRCPDCGKYFQIEEGRTIFRTMEKSLGEVAFDAFSQARQGPYSWHAIPEISKKAWEASAAAVSDAIQRKTESAAMFTDEEIVVLKQYVEHQRIKPIADFGFTHNPRTFAVPQSGMSLNTSPLTLCTEGPEDFMIGNTDPEPERG